jgi:hypothetical protein
MSHSTLQPGFRQMLMLLPGVPASEKHGGMTHHSFQRTLAEGALGLYTASACQQLQPGHCPSWHLDDRHLAAAFCRWTHALSARHLARPAWYL